MFHSNTSILDSRRESYVFGLKNFSLFEVMNISAGRSRPCMPAKQRPWTAVAVSVVITSKNGKKMHLEMSDGGLSWEQKRSASQNLELGRKCIRKSSSASIPPHEWTVPLIFSKIPTCKAAAN